MPVLIAGVGFDDDGTAGVAVIIDNSTQKRAQAELQMAVRIRDEFLSIASHELKTPLTTLSLQSQLKRRRFENGDLLGAAPERVEKMLDTESRQLDRLTRLIDDMLDISRLSSGRLAIRSEPLDLSELVRSVTESVRPQFEAQKTRLVTHVSPGVRIEGDAFRIEQAVMNLITNALKYGRREPVEIRLEQVDHHARIDVRDRGRGIAPEDLERIFQRFERAGHSGDVPGLGLGLYISREIVRGHGGTIAVQSRPGEGSTFTIALPIAGEKKEAGSPS